MRRPLRLQSPRHSLKTTLSLRLKGAKRVAVLGIGSEFRSDDIAGLLVAEDILKFSRGRRRSPKVMSFNGGTAPENMTGFIRDYKPDHVILVDSIDMKDKPGTILCLLPDQISDMTAFSTHKLPAEVLIRYFEETMNARVAVLGIQPKSLDFGKPACATVKSAAREVAKAIRGAVELVGRSS